MDALYTERAWSSFDTFYRTMDLTNPNKALQYDQTNSEQSKQAEQAEQATQDEQAEQTTVPVSQQPDLARSVRTDGRQWLPLAQASD